MPRLQKWEWTFVKVVGAVVVLLLAAGVYAWRTGPSLFRPRTRTFDLQQVSSSLEISFPESARLKRSLVILDGLGSFGWAQVVMGAEDVEAFKESVAQTAGLEFSDGFRMSRITPASREPGGVNPPEWWHPEAVEGGVGRAGHLVDGRLEMLISRPAEGHVTVYLQWTKG